MNPRVTAVSVRDNYRLLLTFKNREVRLFDASPLLDQGGVFDELKDESLFRRAQVNYGTVTWPTGQDICPDTLYMDSVSVVANEPALVKETSNSIGKPPRRQRNT